MVESGDGQPVSTCTKSEKNSSGDRLRVEPHLILPGATDDEAMHLRYGSQKRRLGMIGDMVTLIHLHHLLSLLPLQGFHLPADVHLHLFLNSSRTYQTTQSLDLLVR